MIDNMELVNNLELIFDRSCVMTDHARLTLPISPLKSHQYTGDLVHTFKHGLSQNTTQIWAV